MEKIDLLIIGAGPAGLSTAMHLIKQDKAWAGRMLVLEKAVHPRHKLCGGGVTRRGLLSLQRLGFDLPLPLPQARVDEARLIYVNQTVTVRGQPEFVVFNRVEFDAYLAEQARARGVRLRQDECLESLAVGPDGVRATTSRQAYQAQVVVGADGSKGTVRRAVFSPPLHNAKPRQPGRVARLLEVVQRAPESDPLFSPGQALFDFTPASEALQGYFWDFPTRVNGLPCHNRGLYDARLATARPRANLPHLLDQTLANLSAGNTVPQPEGHPIHWFNPRNRFAAQRLLLVGDAAGADPLFGEGIAPALEYGQLAAESIGRAFARRDFTFRDYRWRILRAPLGRYLLLRWCVAWFGYRLCGHARFMRLLWAFGKLLAAVWPVPPSLDPPARQPGPEHLPS